MVARTGARHIKQVPLAVVDFFQVGILSDILDALLRRDHFVIARHDRDSTKFQTLRQMHSADRKLAGRDLDLVAEFDRLDTGSFDGVSCSAKLAGRADEYTYLVRLNSVLDPAFDPCANRLRLLLRVVVGLDIRDRPVEHRDGAAPICRLLDRHGIRLATSFESFRFTSRWQLACGGCVDRDCGRRRATMGRSLEVIATVRTRADRYLKVPRAISSPKGRLGRAQ